MFPFDVLDLGEPVHLFEEYHGAHEVTSGRRPRSCVGCDFKTVVVIAWGKSELRDFGVQWDWMSQLGWIGLL